jgi:hypothetical protein
MHDTPHVSEVPRQIVERVRSLESLLGGTLNFFLAVLNAHEAPGVGSLAEIELTDRSLQRTTGEPWSEETVRTCHSYLGMFHIASMDHLQSVKALIGDQATIYGALVMSRSVVEAGAQLHWLADSSVGARERVGRSLNLRAQNLKAQMRTMHGLDAPQEVIDNQVLRLAETYDEAADLGFDLVRNGKTGEVERVDASSPSITTMVESLFESMGLEGAAAMYGYMSALSHSHGWALMTQLGTSTADHEAGAVLRGQPTLQMHDIERAVFISAWSYMNAQEPYLRYMGWHTTECHKWKRWVWKKIREGWVEPPA